MRTCLHVHGQGRDKAVWLMAAFEHVTSWLGDLRAHADENVSIIRASADGLGPGRVGG